MCLQTSQPITHAYRDSGTKVHPPKRSKEFPRSAKICQALLVFGHAGTLCSLLLWWATVAGFPADSVVMLCWDGLRGMIPMRRRYSRPAPDKPQQPDNPDGAPEGQAWAGPLGWGMIWVGFPGRPMQDVVCGFPWTLWHICSAGPHRYIRYLGVPSWYPPLSSCNQAESYPPGSGHLSWCFVGVCNATSYSETPPR